MLERCAASSATSGAVVASEGAWPYKLTSSGPGFQKRRQEDRFPGSTLHRGSLSAL